MKHILILLTCSFLSITQALAADVGDIYYSDKTFSTNLNSDKMPIGVVYWANKDQTTCYILALRQPEDMTISVAKTHCANFSTLGTNSGNWKLPTMQQAFQMRTQQWLGVSDNKYNTLNNKLSKIETGQSLKNAWYWTLGYNNQFSVNPYSGAMTMTRETGTRAVRCVMEVSC